MTLPATPPEARCTEALAETLSRRLIARAIRVLRQRHAQLSGDDSGLQNDWEEICVQRQTGLESDWWELYVEDASNLLAYLIRDLANFERTAIWLQTEPGWDWRFDFTYPDHDESEMNEVPPENAQEIVDYLLGHLLNAAESYTNARIRRYIDDYA